MVVDTDSQRGEEEKEAEEEADKGWKPLAASGGETKKKVAPPRLLLPSPCHVSS